jgi:hypothetical protein
MIVTAALIWYDERSEDLELCVRRCADIADRIVAVDGAYRRFPGAKPRSRREQAATIRRVAREVGLQPVIFTPTELWAGQVAKRSFLLREAARDSDWIAVVDADWVIWTDRDVTRAELEGYLDEPEIDVVSVPFCTPSGDSPAATGWHRRLAQTCVPLPHIFRALPGMRVEQLHWWYSALKDGERVWLWHGPDRNRRVVTPQPLRAWYEIEHRTLSRDAKQILANRAFCNDRVMVLERTGQEDDMPGLPPPVFDFDTVPY